jgi:hypothetical protein
LHLFKALRLCFLGTLSEAGIINFNFLRIKKGFTAEGRDAEERIKNPKKYI